MKARLRELPKAFRAILPTQAIRGFGRPGTITFFDGELRMEDGKHTTNGKTTNVPLLDFEAAPAGGGRVQLVVKHKGDPVHLDVVSYANAKDRRRLFDDLSVLLKSDPEALFVHYNSLLIEIAVKALKTAEQLATQQTQAEAEPDRIAPPWPTPWDGEVRLGDVLDEVYKAIRKHVVLSHESAVAVTLWVAWSYAVVRTPGGPTGDTCPILAICSPTKRCGKSTLLTLLSYLCPAVISASNVSSAAVFRLVEREKPTLLIDECECFVHESEELRGLLNASHKRETSYVLRCVGESFTPQKFSTWCVKCVALIGRLPDTLTDRSILVRLQRKRADETVATLDDEAAEHLRTLSRKLSKAIDASVQAAMYAARPTLPVTLHDRAKDNWKRLVALADIGGGRWPAEARKSAVVLSLDDGEPESLGVQAIIDAVGVFGNVDRLRPEELVERLLEIPDRPWPTLSRGRPLTAKKLASVLAPYGVQAVRDHGGRWYRKTDFVDAFQRYYSPPPETICQSVTDASKCLSDNDLRRDGSKIENETEIQSVTAQVLDNQGLTFERDGLTDRNGSMGENEETEWVF
jgi:putative DNA primase/helicase